MCGARLCGARLRGARLRGARLRGPGARRGGSRLGGSGLRHPRLRGARARRGGARARRGRRARSGGRCHGAQHRLHQFVGLLLGEARDADAVAAHLLGDRGRGQHGGALVLADQDGDLLVDAFPHQRGERVAEGGGDGDPDAVAVLLLDRLDRLHGRDGHRLGQEVADLPVERERHLLAGAGRGLLLLDGGEVDRLAEPDRRFAAEQRRVRVPRHEHRDGAEHARGQHDQDEGYDQHDGGEPARPRSFRDRCGLRPGRLPRRRRFLHP
ncbi:pentapeptide repeat-containing protein [Nonomuraea sp. NPDC049152]|uniref:pentapeptide repeat-containing protein n=1 Tax=Nonomuraea sp. NPDC049152 TaxID=3154350 RepID=UPI0033C43AA2